MTDARSFSLLLGITGSIAAYKAADIIRQLRALRDPNNPDRRVDVRVILTAHGAEFITPLTLQTLTGFPVYQELFQSSAQWDVQHVGLADNADLLLIAPATANIMAKMACGLADDLLSTTALACQAPQLIAPAMNVHMWEASATQENLRCLQQRGVIFIGPQYGELACGYCGAGKMSSVEDIVAAVRPFFLQNTPGKLSGKSVLITAGPTREYLDPVRFISNPSSGKMGYALAAAAQARGAQVILVSGPVALAPPAGVELISITSCEEMAQAVANHRAEADIIIGAAAPVDFRPQNCAAQKVKKSGNNETVNLLPTTDILLEAGQHKKAGQIIIAFAAETENIAENAREKLRRKAADIIVANDVSAKDAGFAGDNNRATLFFAAGRSRELPLQSKRTMADAILDAAEELLPGDAAGE